MAWIRYGMTPPQTTIWGQLLSLRHW